MIDWQLLLLTFVKALAMVLVVMTLAGYTVLAERKVAAWVQGRPGPNRTTTPFVAIIPILGPFLQRLGILQLPADGAKFLFKEEPVPGHVNKLYFTLAPAVALIPALTTMTVLPFGQFTSDGTTTPLVLADLDIGMLFILAVSSLGVYGIILAGWASNSKFPFLGGIRASAQMISYELTMGLSLLPVFMWAGGTLSLTGIVDAQANGLWNIITLFPCAFLFLVSLFAETNRLPFDMPESETDLVAGFNTEYGAFKFGLFFTGEYAHVVIGSAVFVCLFLGGWTLPFVTYPEGLTGAVLSVAVMLAKTLCLVFFFLLTRWTLPRFRYDQIMKLGWTRLLPFALLNLVLYTIAMAIIVKA